MKEVTRKMIVKYGCKEKKLDFMGYPTPNDNDFSFHHTQVPNRKGGPYAEWNGSILNTNTGHPYIHLIEHYDYDMFMYLTKKLVEENHLGKLDLQILRQIDFTLRGFEREHCSTVNRKGNKKILKPEYTMRNYENKFR